MMLRSFLTRAALLAALLCTSAPAAMAQSVRIATPTVAYRYDIATLTQGTMHVVAPNRLAVNGHEITADAIDITIDATPHEAHRVDIALNASGRPIVTADGALAPHLSVTQADDRIEIVASAALQDEVTYHLSGTSVRSVVIRGSYKCAVVLDGVDITAAGTLPALWIDNGKRIDMVLPDGTINRLADAPDNALRAALLIKGHAEWKGGGALSLRGRSRHAYASNEYTWLREGFGRLTIEEAASDGLHIRQYLRMDGGTIVTANTAGDGIDVERTLRDDGTPTDDELNGQILINGGTLDLSVSATDVKGIKSEGDCTLSGGTLRATVSGNGSKGLSCDGNLLIQQKTATPTRVEMTVTATTHLPNTTNEAKARGIKVKGNFTFDGGT
ncbi:MAG: carbohydrate-binding domain-containing protein, partial [Bacteroidaceae bacterium]|nr:carbohydrate-binding domain-containing protein [Bacteroidaceae bacterium]